MSDNMSSVTSRLESMKSVIQQQQQQQKIANMARAPPGTPAAWAAPATPPTVTGPPTNIYLSPTASQYAHSPAANYAPVTPHPPHLCRYTPPPQKGDDLDVEDEDVAGEGVINHEIRQRL